jgi:hypothetical protein
MNKERLQTLITVLKRVAESRFDINSWQETEFEEDAVETEAELHACGMTACVGGWLAVSPEFKADGGMVTYYGSPSFNGKFGEEAIEKYLMCDTATAQGVCGLDRYVPREHKFYPLHECQHSATLPQVIAKLESLL